MAATKGSDLLKSTPKRQHNDHTGIQLLCKEGREQMKKEDVGGALKTFKKAFLLSCKHSSERMQKTCLFNLGAAYVCVGKPKKALKCFIKCRIYDKEHEDGDLYFNIAAAYDNMQEYGKAVKFYEKAINEYNSKEIVNIADALIKLGYCFANTGELSSAAHSFRLAGHSYLKTERLEDAAMAMREATKYMINSQAFSKAEVLQTLNFCVQSFKGVSDKKLLGTLYNHVGLHYAEMKCFSQAEKCFTESLNLCSGNQFSIRRIAVLLQNLGAVDNALYQYEKSLRSHAEAADMYGSLGERNAQGQCLCNLAFAYSQLKNYDLAEFYYLQALQAFVDADDPMRQCHVCEGLGATYFCLGNLDQAISYYKKALTMSGQSKGTTDAIRERILGKLTDVIEHKVSHQHTATTKESASMRRLNKSPSNHAIDDYGKSVASQHLEPCLNSGITSYDSSDDEPLLQRSFRRDRGHEAVLKVKQPNANEQNASGIESTRQNGTQRNVSESKSNSIPAEDEDRSKYRRVNPLNQFRSAEINNNYTSEKEEEMKNQVQGNISPSRRTDTREEQKTRSQSKKKLSGQEESDEDDSDLEELRQVEDYDLENELQEKDYMVFTSEDDHDLDESSEGEDEPEEETQAKKHSKVCTVL
ncbi:tetratricopeptide repeat protein 24-like isoform X2 [Hyperolius riggenbachi]